MLAIFCLLFACIIRCSHKLRTNLCFNAFVSYCILEQQTGSSGAAGTELKMSTEADIKNMTSDYSFNKEAVEKMLIDFVCTVNIKADKARA